MVRYATVVGSRELPAFYEKRLIRIIELLNCNLYTIRSGGASGSDHLVTLYGKSREIYVPWFHFCSAPDEIIPSNFKNYEEARSMAAKIHPNWSRLNDGVRKLQTRNVYQVLGRNLNEPSEFVVCYTADGATTKTGYSTGGTGQAIRTAVLNKVKVYNVYNEFDYAAIRDYLEAALIEKNCGQDFHKEK